MILETKKSNKKISLIVSWGKEQRIDVVTAYALEPVRRDVGDACPIDYGPGYRTSRTVHRPRGAAGAGAGAAGTLRRRTSAPYKRSIRHPLFTA
ncbi:hypothetical protein EVAR_103801_1 [Eumeta japonica]|uniref:Uncharacterized protein n=1 Tax=Eumeta variegata TaxID=151549 RepID=A0A4C1Z474_EUMVA|nr:hypothetical protein EVAR_103801_1 [Eumeta japonica]